MKIGKDYIGVGCGAVIVNDSNQILLQLRLKSPEANCWCIPGGKVELFENVEDAVKREVLEELGVEVSIISLLGICNHIIDSEKTHWVSPSYLCKIISGVPKIMEEDKHSDLRWFDLSDLPDNITITTKVAIDNYNLYMSRI